MDRREAIRKLAAGGAVAVGASTVLSSRDVAYAASVPGTGLSDVPGPGEPLPISSSSGNGNGTVLIGDASGAVCDGGSSSPSSTFAWRINAYNVADTPTILGPLPPQFLIKNSADVAVIVAGTNFSNNCSICPTPYSSPTSTNSTVSLRKRLFVNLFGGIEIEVPLSAGDSYDIGLMRTWQCAGAGSAVTAEYRMTGVYPNAPTVENISYTVG